MEKGGAFNPDPVVSDRVASLNAALPFVGNPVIGDAINLPTFSKDPLATLASLSTCYVNLERGCDFHHDERSRHYLYAWQRPAPIWCAGDPNRGRDLRGGGTPSHPIGSRRNSHRGLSR